MLISMVRSTEIDLKREIGRNIAEARGRRELTQKKLAERLGCSPDGLAEMELGRRFPRFKVLVAMSQELGVPLRDLVDQVDQADPRNDRRARLELQGRALLSELSDEFLELAIEQLSALTKRDHRHG
jgi:transcriptional regulator with XRE-family HTH domain